MRGWLVRVAVLLALAPITASADTLPTVEAAIVGNDGTSITRFTLRFSEPMAPLGKGNAPISMSCSVFGEGRWVDPSTYVWEFEKPLPGGITCSAELKEGLSDLEGREIVGNRIFPIDSGGPFARAVLPRWGDIDEDQTFFVATNGPVDRASVASGAYCTVDGIGERIAVDLLPKDTPDKILSAMTDRWDRRSFLEGAGLPSDLPDNARNRAETLANVVALKCRRPLPPGRDMALVWGASIRSPGGRRAGEDKRFDYEVRREFSARLSCSRVNAAAGCNPIEPIKLMFSGDVPRAQALAARLDVGGGKLLAPVDEGNEQNLSEVRFKPAFPPAIKAKLILPADLRDDSGRALANARRFPLEFEIASIPPLVKFASTFGILESSQGGVLPVTVRGVEPSLAQSIEGVSGGAARIVANDAAIADWVRRVEASERIDIRDEGTEENPKPVNYTGTKSLLAAVPSAKKIDLALPGKGKEFEVVGIPLTEPGFYVVELASPQLGRVLLGRPATRYVSTAALVTDMVVHFKWGRSSSLAWVTSLEDGKPVRGAEVRVTDSCSGKQLAAGTTDRQGRVMVGDVLPEPGTRSGCEGLGTDSPPLMVSARNGGDFSFTMTDWGDGIRPYDFELPFGWNEPEPVLHNILDRTLLRAGETVHMTHVYREQTPTGFRSAGALNATLLLQHRGSETKFELPLVLDSNGIGESQWTPPKGSPMGDYDITARIGPARTEASVDDASPDTNDTVYTAQSIRVDEYRLPTMRATVAGPRTPAVRPSKLPIDLFLGYLSGGGAPGAPVKLRTAFEMLWDTPDGWDGWSFGGSEVKEGTLPLDEDRGGPVGAETPSASTIPLALDSSGALRTQLDVPALEDSMRMTVEMDYQDANGETLTASTQIPIYRSAVRLGIRSDGWVQRADEMRIKLAALDLDDRAIRGQPIEVALYTREILSARRRLIGGFYAFDNVVKTTRIAGSCSVATDAQGLASCELDPGVSGEVIAVATSRDRDGNEARAVTSVYLAGDDDWWFGGDNGDRMDIIPDSKTYRAGDTAHVQVRMPFRKATALVTVEREGVLSSFVTDISGKDPVIDVKLDGAYAPDVYISVMAVRGRIAGWKMWLAEFAKKLATPFTREMAQPTATVDLAKPSYRIGMAKVKVGWESHSLQVAVKPDRDKYRVREQAQVAVQVKAPGGKAPQSAEFAFAAVDEALLALSPNESWNLLDAMMGERPISVLTSTAQMQVVGKRHYGRKAVPAGGGGGGDLSALTRTDFKPVLLWQGRVKLDSAGRANVTVPLADSLSSYKLVAIATSGGQLFGTGMATIRTVQDLTIYSGVPPLVRSGDEYGATFTLRNGTNRAMEVVASAEVDPAVTSPAPQTVTVPAGGAAPVTWLLTAPEHVDALKWTVSVRSADGKSTDRIQVDEQVVPAVPEMTWAATFLRIGSAPFPIAPPAGALPGRGSVDIAFTDSPAPALQGVRDYMRWYPYGCFEQRLSKLIALDDEAAWTKLTGELPAYTARDGLLRYWPGDSMRGSIALTSYALSITAEAGLEWPEEHRQRLIEALKSVVDGRLQEDGDWPSDMKLLRIDALAALARNGASTPEMVSQVTIPLRDMPTAMLADWIIVVEKTKGVSAASRVAAETALKGRIVYEGTRLDLTDRQLAPWWMMTSDDEMAIKALLAVIGRRGWEADAPRMMIGVALRQHYGHWDTTPANAWGTIATKRFAEAFPSVTAGITTITLGGTEMRRTWPKPEPMRFALPGTTTPLVLAHSTPTKPWATISVRAAVPLMEPSFAGYRVQREVSFLERKDPGKVSVGDVMKIRLTLEAPAGRTWVVVDDPIPAGASIVSGTGGQSSLLASRALGGNWWPAYIERGFDSWRAYYDWLPQGRTSVEYAVRINNPGRFQMPPTRVEAMYSPEIRAALPNRPILVER